MRTLAFGAALVGAWLVAGSHGPGTRPAPTAPRVALALTPQAAAPAPEIAPHNASAPHVPLDVSPATLTAVVQQYCVVCHNDQLLTGNVSLANFDVDQAAQNAEKAERMVRKLRAGMMPPPGIPRPGGDTLLALVETIEANVDKAAKANPRLGERRFQRLSRTEYERVVKDLLDLEIEGSKWLPPDVLVGAFDNASAGQMLSTTLLDSFMRAASEVALLAVGNPEAMSSTAKYNNPVEISQHAWDHIEGTPFGTRGGMVITHDFPADGDYVFQVETSFGDGTSILEDVDISVAAEPKALLMLERKAAQSNPVQTELVHVQAGQQTVSAAFVSRIEGPYEDRFTPPNWSSANLGNNGANYGITVLPHITTLLITGPKNVKGVSETRSRQRIFSCHPTGAAEQRTCAESIIGRLMTQAYRRPIKADDVADLMKFYDEGFAAGGFEVGVRTSLEALLAAPEFLFRLEREPANARAGQAYRLSDMDLATRLSFFLWDAAPDAELLKVAETGRLSNAGVFDQQVKRMLKDPRSEALSTRFVSQWLRLQDVGQEVWPEPFYYPDFSEQLAESMVKETQMFFQYLVQADRPLLELYTADYSFLNERLAKHYGIDGVSGDDFRKVQYTNDQRRGVLGHGSVLLLTSVADRTSPVIRGKWVMEVLMGTPPPPPPPNIPAFEATKDSNGGRRLTTRERMAAHSASPVCSSCHRFIDPIGLALDNFDVTGKWRIRENMAPLDTRGDYYDGTPIASPKDLVAVLVKRPTPLVRNFTANLMAYAIGRPVEYYDYPTIRAISKAAEQNEYRMSSFIMGVVKSDLFQMRQAQTSAN